jgi:hypothetical protein
VRAVLDLHRAGKALEAIDRVIGKKPFDRVFDRVRLRAAREAVEERSHQVIVDIQGGTYGISLADISRAVNSPR